MRYGATERRTATEREIEYVLELAQYAENVETDGLSLYWSEPGTMAEFSTQYPVKWKEEEE